MASRAVSRAFRSVICSAGNSFRAAEGTSRSILNPFPARNGGETAILKRLCAKSVMPLHNTAAAARPVSHLYVSSRIYSALYLDPQRQRELGDSSISSDRQRQTELGDSSISSDRQCQTELGDSSTSTDRQLGDSSTFTDQQRQMELGDSSASTDRLRPTSTDRQSRDSSTFTDRQRQMELGDSSTCIDRQREMEPENAFDGIAPHASPSSSTVMNKGPYDVFINHCGRDVKHKLASSIYYTLQMHKLRAFLDVKELELGDSIPDEIQNAMRTAAIHIAIFSKNYAHSPWCLSELSFMLKTGTRILPVFYYVEPNDLRWVAQGKGLYAPAFSQHQKKGRYSADKMEEWKTALKRVSYLSGYTLNSHNKDRDACEKLSFRLLGTSV